MNLQQIKFGIVLVLALSSCSSPQKLVNRAIKKDSTVLDPYLKQMLPDDSVCREEISLNTRPPKPIEVPRANPLVEIIRIGQENRTERVVARQENRTERTAVRQEERSDRRETVATERTNRVETRQENRTEREQEKTKQKEIKRKGRTWMWLLLIVISFIVGYNLKNNEHNFGNFFKGALAIARRFFLRF